MKKIGFNNELYVKYQTEKIKERIKMFDNKLYLEFGGKLFDDYHAKRVLPGFELDAKIRLLKELKDITEIIFCINANDIEKKKIRADYGISYDLEVLRLINIFREMGIKVNSVVITLYQGQVSADKFKNKLEEIGIKTYFHTPTKGYPTDVDVIVSDLGYGANPYIETTKPLVVVNAPGPCSGKLATCLSQLYHEYKKGIKAGYAKFETFPVWDLPLKHPVNMAYEAATADLNDKNMIDSFHLDSYGISAVNYNRDLEVFPVLKNILNKITGEDIYKSPTDMGVNSIGKCIVNDKLIQDAAKKEIVRRYYKALVDVKLNDSDPEIPKRIKLLMNELNIDTSIMRTIYMANEKEFTSGKKSMALELENGEIITGRQTDLLSPASSLIINCIKHLTNIPDDVDLLSPSVLKPILKMKKEAFNNKTTLNLNDVLIALSICSVTNPIVEKALKNLKKLNNCDAYATYIVEKNDLEALRNLLINLICEPVFNNEY
ncbi:MAG: DUF1846 domain-containing protein [bacterium]|nr:DUF1846 domain-containing protein [bacterium]